MRLFYQTIGDGPPVMILHGLFGSHDNWLGVARLLAERYKLILPDLRNHGQSPHDDAMDYELMAVDVCELIDELRLDSVALVGHSMGGKVAMNAALKWPARVSALVVVDIAPKQYEPRHAEILEAMLALRPERYDTRAQILEALAPRVPDMGVRQFLIKSLSRKDRGGYDWKLNLRAIAENYSKINAPLSQSTVWPKRALFVRGARSNYILPGDQSLIRELFPYAEILTIADADHWVHADAPKAVAEAISQFIRE